MGIGYVFFLQVTTLTFLWKKGNSSHNFFHHHPYRFPAVTSLWTSSSKTSRFIGDKLGPPHLKNDGIPPYFHPNPDLEHMSEWVYPIPYMEINMSWEFFSSDRSIIRTYTPITTIAGMQVRHHVHSIYLTPRRKARPLPLPKSQRESWCFKTMVCTKIIGNHQ